MLYILSMRRWRSTGIGDARTGGASAGGRRPRPIIARHRPWSSVFGRGLDAEALQYSNRINVLKIINMHA